MNTETVIAILALAFLAGRLSGDCLVLALRLCRQTMLQASQPTPSRQESKGGEFEPPIP